MQSYVLCKRQIQVKFSLMIFFCSVKNPYFIIPYSILIYFGIKYQFKSLWVIWRVFFIDKPFHKRSYSQRCKRQVCVNILFYSIMARIRRTANWNYNLEYINNVGDKTNSWIFFHLLNQHFIEVLTNLGQTFEWIYFRKTFLSTKQCAGFQRKAIHLSA